MQVIATFTIFTSELKPIATNYNTMLTKYEELKLASNVLGQPMTKLLDAKPHEIREACINSNADPSLSTRISEVITEASQKWNGFYFADSNLTPCHK